MKQYDHTKIEKRWRKEWAKSGVYETSDLTDRPKFYILDMFPYPSGEGLHVGHPKGYIATDIVSRMKRMQGFNVLHPMGFDAFGLPAENYAIKTKTNPMDSVAKNVARYKSQLEILGFDYDWSREVNTTDPKFYTWTQWIFLKLLEKGLAYESYEPINWCPSCKTGLANEDVEDGRCERCSTPVEKKPMRQWVLRITAYADRLLKDLDGLDWPESIKESQRNWIGRSEGAEIDFKIKGREDELKVFTTRPDTLFGVTYVVVAPEHDFITHLIADKGSIQNRDEVIRYVAAARVMTQIERTDAKKEKTGVRLDGVLAINPANGEEVPVYVADYVLAEYGTGAVMAVPAHDERDFEFAKRYNLPVKEVVIPYRYYKPNPPVTGKKTVVRRNVHAIIVDPKTGRFVGLKWKKFPWTTFPMGGIDEGEDPAAAAKREAYEETGFKGLAFKAVLGGQVKAEYFAAHKDENRISFTSAVLFELTSLDRDPIKAEENEKHEVIWLDPKSISLDSMTHAELDVWISRMGKEPTAMVEEGVLVESGKFTDMPSGDAKKAITDFVGGKWVVKYKLKEWVFSRQRYWGEPFPVMHALKAKKALLIHGFEGNGNGHWFKKLKSALQDAGVEVFNPTMTNSDHATVESWLSELKPLVKDFGPDDIIVGHSIGSSAALHLVQSEGRNIGRLFLVASAIGKLRDDKFWGMLQEMDGPDSDIPALRKFWETPVDYARLAVLAPHVTLVRSKDDVVIPPITHEKLPEVWKVEEWDGFGHFDSAKGTEFEALWEKLWSVSAKEVVATPEKDLPVELPKVKSYEPTGTGESPLAGVEKWVNVKVGGKLMRRETNTMPQWAGSSWYYLRYMDPDNKKALVDPKAEKYWNQVDFYVGGAEHATRHLIYARFWHKFLYDIGVVTTTEPFKRLQSVGLIMGEDGRKMSKRFGNVVNPDEIVAQYGADTLRVYEMFMGPFDQAIAWSTGGIMGARRFIERVWKMQGKVAADTSLSRDAEALLHRTIAKVTDDIGVLRHNTAISALMILSNELDKEASIPRDAYEAFLKLLAPFAPHVADELWSHMGNKGSIHTASWPVADAAKAAAEEDVIAVQVNGKTRATFKAPKGADRAALEAAALALDEVKKWIGEAKPKKVIVVPGRMVSIVVNP